MIDDHFLDIGGRMIRGIPREVLKEFRRLNAIIRDRDAQILRLPAALDKNEGKSFAGSPSFFAAPCAFATPFLE